MTADDDLAAARADLSADCSRCVALCCVVPAFAASADFAIDKPAQTPCVHLRSDDRCGIHDQLARRGFPGCVVFDCLGAGQRVTQLTFAGADRRTAGAGMAAVFPVMRQLTELLWHLTEARTLSIDPAVGELLARVDELTRARAAELTGLDVAALRREAGELLGRVSQTVRAAVPGRVGDRRGADLTGALFLTRPQLAAATGNRSTRLPGGLPRPGHWSAAVAPRTQRRGGPNHRQGGPHRR